MARFGEESAQGDAFRIKQIDGEGEGLAETLADFGPDRLGEGIVGFGEAFGGERRGVLKPLGIDVGVIVATYLGEAGDAAAAAEPLHGSGLAEADGTVRREPHMTDLASVTRGTFVELAVEDESGPEARAGGAKHEVPGAAPRAKDPLGEGAGVGVVHESGFATEGFGQPRADGLVVPAGMQVGRTGDHASGAIKRATTGYAYAHGTWVRGLKGLDAGDEFGVGGVKFAGGDAHGFDDPGAVPMANGTLGAADIEADPVVVGRRGDGGS